MELDTVLRIHIVAFALLLTTQLTDASGSDDPVGTPGQCRFAQIQNGTSLVDQCLKRTLQFLRKYLRRLDKNKQYDVCRNFPSVKDCLVPILDECPDVRHRYHTMLSPILDHFTCSCDDNTVCTREDMNCFEAQYRGIMFSRCNDYFKFNLEMGTKDYCYFLQEQVDCKTALVSSACGMKAGEYAFRLLQFLAHTESKSKECPLHQNTAYEGFQYTADCPTIFIQDMTGCSYQYLRGNIITFDPNNDLVAQGTKEDVRAACEAYRDYQLCMRPIKKACRTGTKAIFDYDASLRKYTRKMDYICLKKNKAVYRKSVYCYQDVLENQNLGQCDHIWKDLVPWVHNVNANQFFCKGESADTLAMKKELDRLRACYERVFRGRCGDTAGSMMGHMIRMAFRDPAYLRYKYRPHCSLHRGLKSQAVTHDILQIATTDTLHSNRDTSNDGSHLETKWRTNLVTVVVTWTVLPLGIFGQRYL